MTLPSDIARCPGVYDAIGWMDECLDCQRRTAPPGGQEMAPPEVIGLWCHCYIPPDRPEDQRLRELAREQGLGP